MKSFKLPTLDPSSAVLGRCIPGELVRLAFVAGADGAIFSRLGSMQADCELYSASLANDDTCRTGGGDGEATSLEENTGGTGGSDGEGSSLESNTGVTGLHVISEGNPEGTDPSTIAGGSNVSS
jgi:hypothetical protein